MEDDLVEVVLLRTIRDDGDSNRKRIVHLRRSDTGDELGLFACRGFVVLLANPQEGVDYAFLNE